MQSEPEARLCALPSPPQRQERVSWLHIPKTGTSFMTTIMHYACVGLPPSLSAADFVAQEAKEHSAAAAASPMSTSSPWAQLDRAVNISSSCYAHLLVDRGWAVRSDDSAIVGWRAHVPLVSWNADREHLVSMFRQPAQRLLSGFHHAGGPHGVPPLDRSSIRTAPDYARYCPRHGPRGTHAPPSTTPERSIQCVANKQCAYLLGRPCVAWSDAHEAGRRLRSGRRMKCHV